MSLIMCLGGMASYVAVFAWLIWAQVLCFGLLLTRNMFPTGWFVRGGHHLVSYTQYRMKVSNGSLFGLAGSATRGFGANHTRAL